jgi:cardiolipin synthase (CMP-forming)
MATPLLNTANQLTILRMVLAPLLVVLVLGGELVWAIVVFAAAGITDALDGLIARWGHQKTTFGAMMDPVADKVLLISSFVVLTWGPNLFARIPAWLTVTTLSRDLIIVVSVVVVNLTVGRRIFLPSLLGKVCTATQLLTVGVVLLANGLRADWPVLAYLYWATLLLTAASAIHYVFQASTAPPKPEDLL